MNEHLATTAAQDFCIGSLTIERDGYKRLADSRRTDIVRLVEEIKRLTFERDAALLRTDIMRLVEEIKQLTFERDEALRALAGKEPEPEVNPVFAAIAVHQSQGVR